MSTNATIANQWIKRLPFVVILLAVVLTSSLVLANLWPVVRFGLSAPVSESTALRRNQAYTARYTAMAEAYLAREKAALRSNQAYAARYTAMAEAYLAWGGAARRGIQADAARYTAMADSYLAQKAAALRGMNADTARYTAMAEFYSVWLNDPALSAGMAEYFHVGH